MCVGRRGGSGGVGGKEEGKEEAGCFVFLKANHIYGGGEGATLSFSEKVSYISYIQKYL